MTASILTDVVLRYLRDDIGELPPEVAVTVVREWPDKWSVYLWFGDSLSPLWRAEQVHYEAVLDLLDLEHLFIAEKIRKAWRAVELFAGESP